MHILLYTYIYTCCRVKIGPRFGVFISQWSKLKVKNWSELFLFSPVLLCLGGMLKSQSCVGVQNSYFASCGGCQKRGFRKKWQFLFLSFKTKRKRKDIEKEPTIENVVLGVVGKKRILAKMDFLMPNTEGKRTRIS